MQTEKNNLTEPARQVVTHATVMNDLVILELALAHPSVDEPDERYQCIAFLQGIHQRVDLLGLERERLEDLAKLQQSKLTKKVVAAQA
jgi:Ser/Thr protein kinase RdoA (MazF antagonist)